MSEQKSTSQSNESAPNAAPDLPVDPASYPNAPNILTEEEVAVLSELFGIYQKATPGFVNTEGMRQIIRMADYPPVTDDEAARLMAKWGAGSQMSLEQMIEMCRDMVKTRTVEQVLRASFAPFDRERKGLVDRAAIISAIVAYGKAMTEKDATDLVDGVMGYDPANPTPDHPYVVDGKIRVDPYVALLLDGAK